MDGSRIAFHGTLAELLARVERGEMVPRLQASHAPPCEFRTAFQVLNGIRHTVTVIHGPKGCPRSARWVAEVLIAAQARGNRAAREAGLR